MKGRPSKPIELVKGHRTKKEKEARSKSEEALLTGSSFKEWDDVKNNTIAHKEFTRLKKIFKAIKKDDSLHESIINRYCLLHAECKKFEYLAEQTNQTINELTMHYNNKELEFIAYLDKKNTLTSTLMQCDKKIMEKRKMMFDIEKENIMTIASVLRSIPKKPEEEKEFDPMAKLLGG